MKYTYIEFIGEWHKYLIEQYNDSEFEIKIEKQNILFLKNILNTAINLDTHSGFLTLEFKTITLKNDFLTLINAIDDYQEFEKYKFKTTFND